MTTSYDSSSMYSGFLSLPTELRCEIYNYLLTDSHAVTISAGYTTIFGHRIQDRARKQDIPGLPLDLVPLVRHTRAASLLSVVKAPEIAIDGQTDDAEQITDALGMPAPLALLLTSRLVNDELTDYMRGKKQIKTARAQSASPKTKGKVEDDNEGLSLYVTYPYGVLVLKSMYPYLLKQARRVYISGYYTNAPTTEPSSPTSSDESDEERPTPSTSFAVAESFGAPTSGRSFLNSSRLNIARPAVRPRLRLDPPLQRQQRHTSRTQLAFPNFSAETNDLAPMALGQLIRTLFPPTPSQCTKLSTRILYPGENSYGTVWSDDNSPVSHILRNICGGEIDMKCKRGGLGTGLYLTAGPKTDGRVVSTSWENWRAGNGAGGMRRGRLDVEDLDGFLVGENWKE